MLSNLGLRVAPYKAVAVLRAEVPTRSEAPVSASSLFHQCAAARVTFDPCMNPVTVVPEKRGRGLLYLGGVPTADVAVDLDDTLDIRQLPAYLQERIRSMVVGSYQTIQSAFDFVVIEGAGSPIDLPPMADLANTWMAEITDASALLLCKATRGGVAAAIVGTHACLPAGVRAQVRGYVLNDVVEERFTDHVTQMAAPHIAWPCLGTIPHIPVWDDYDGPTKDEWYDEWARVVAETVDFTHIGWTLEGSH